MSAHTPGPWIARPDPHGFANDCCIGLDDDCIPHDYVAVCHNRDGNMIAAAPSLYEAAHNAYGVLSACVRPAGGVDDAAAIRDAMRLLLDAMNKAEGRA